MKISILKEDEIKDDYDMVTIKMSRGEALLTIESLSRQMFEGNCNSGRFESFDKEGKYFTIFVEDEK